MRNKERSVALLKLLIREVLDGFSMSGTRASQATGNMRYDVALSHQRRGNILTDEENIEQQERQDTQRAACCLIYSKNGKKVLAVSRGIGSTEWALPGGKVEIGESDSDAAIRELYEETGLHMQNPRKVFKQDSCGFETTTFVGNVSGKILSSNEGDVKWIDRTILLNYEQSPFAKYAQSLFDELQI